MAAGAVEVAEAITAKLDIFSQIFEQTWLKNELIVFLIRWPIFNEVRLLIIL